MMPFVKKTIASLFRHQTDPLTRRVKPSLASRLAGAMLVCSIAAPVASAFADVTVKTGGKIGDAYTEVCDGGYCKRTDTIMGDGVTITEEERYWRQRHERDRHERDRYERDHYRHPLRRGGVHILERTISPNDRYVPSDAPRDAQP